MHGAEDVRSLARSRVLLALRHKFSALISFHGESVDENSSDCQPMRSRRVATRSGHAAAARVAHEAHALRRIYPWNARLWVGGGKSSPAVPTRVRISRGRRRGAEILHKGRWLFVLGESRDARRDARFSVTDLPPVEPRAARDRTILACLPTCSLACLRTYLRLTCLSAPEPRARCSLCLERCPVIRDIGD